MRRARLRVARERDASETPDGFVGVSFFASQTRRMNARGQAPRSSPPVLWRRALYYYGAIR